MRFEVLFPSKFFKAADFIESGERTFTIKRVKQDTLKGRDGTDELKVMVEFEGEKKQFVLSKVNAVIIADLYGPEVEDWAGKRITLRSERTLAFGSMMDVVRVKPEAPRGSTRTSRLKKSESDPLAAAHDRAFDLLRLGEEEAWLAESEVDDYATEIENAVKGRDVALLLALATRLEEARNGVAKS